GRRRCDGQTADPAVAARKPWPRALHRRLRRRPEAHPLRRRERTRERGAGGIAGNSPPRGYEFAPRCATYAGSTAGGATFAGTTTLAATPASRGGTRGARRPSAR